MADDAVVCMNMNWAYIAGFFDGEGSCGYTHAVGRGNGSLAIKIQIAQKKPAVLRAIVVFLAKHGIAAKITLQKKQNCSILYTTKSEYTAKFLKSIFPWLVVKKCLAQDLLRANALWPPLHIRSPYFKFARSGWGTPKRGIDGRFNANI